MATLAQLNRWLGELAGWQAPRKMGIGAGQNRVRFPMPTAQLWRIVFSAASQPKSQEIDMHRTRIFRSRNLIAGLVLGTLIIAVVVAQGVTVDSSAAQINLTRQSRPHPQSHIKIGEPDNVTRLPRPHPKSHIRLTATAMPLYQP